MQRGAFARVAAAIVATSTGLFVAVPPAAAAGPAWSIVGSPNKLGAPSASLRGVGCAAATTCFAVGSSQSVLGRASAIERWNGTKWSVVSNPDPVDAVDAQLASVACPSTTTCFAGGSYETASGVTKPLIEQWNGTKWSVVSIPTLAGAQDSQVLGLACANATRCFAVGDTNAGGPLKTLIETWDGTSWSVVASPSPGTSTDANSLAAVSCGSSASCFAVGHHVDSQRKVLIERWAGAGWSVVPSPTPAGATASELAGVACPTAGVCFAAGTWDGAAARTLLERWNGTSWSLIANPDPSDTSGHPPYLAAIGCASTTSCFATGAYWVGESINTLVKQWNGSTWATVASPSPATYNQLLGVACPAPSSCVAVGDRRTSAFATLAEVWTGTTWSVVASPTPAPPLDSLAAVGCRSAGNCFAVGESGTGSGLSHPLIERWKGASWTFTPSPDGPDGQQENRLRAVTCNTDTHCFAAGSQNFAFDNVRLALKEWNGSTWSNVAVQEPPNPISSQLDGIACPSPTKCFAVGRWRGNKVTGLVERWAGTTWAPMASPNTPDMTYAVVNGIACPTASSCFAVGEQVVNSVNKTLIWRWTGQAWSKVSSPTPSGATRSELLGVACSSASGCSAVGTYVTNGLTRAFAERWNGTSWSMTTGLGPQSVTASRLASVSCPGAANCYAVGSYTLNGVTKPQILQFNGTSWSAQNTPAPTDTKATTLSGIACTATTSCFAVGDNYRKNLRATFVERYS